MSKERLLKSTDVERNGFEVYYDPQTNYHIGQDREKNLTRRYFTTENLIVEIKTDYRARETGNFFIEMEQILCGENKWRDSGLKIENQTNWWMIVIPKSHDTYCEDYHQHYVMINKSDLKQKLNRLVKDKKYSKPQPLADNAPDFIREGHKSYYAYKIDNCPQGGKRYSRGILIPIGLLSNPYYL